MRAVVLFPVIGATVRAVAHLRQCLLVRLCAVGQLFGECCHVRGCVISAVPGALSNARGGVGRCLRPGLTMPGDNRGALCLVRHLQW